MPSDDPSNAFASAEANALLTRRLLSTTDAAVWAEEFVKLHGGDEGLMISWFANAIETGRSAGQQGWR